jgi:hypothetical protein
MSDDMQAQLEADIAELRRHMKDPDIMDAMISLVREGKVVNSGRRRQGKIVWISAANAKRRRKPEPGS